jgi:hypothetical protein
LIVPEYIGLLRDQVVWLLSVPVVILTKELLVLIWRSGGGFQLNVGLLTENRLPLLSSSDFPFVNIVISWGQALTMTIYMSLWFF